MRTVYLLSWLLALQLNFCRPEKGKCPANFLDKTDDRLTFINNSPKPITFSFSYEYPLDSNFLHLSVPGQLVIDANPNKIIPPNSSGRYSSRGCWEGMFRDFISSGKLRIMIFEIDSIWNLSGSEVISRGLYKNYLYTLDQLKAIDWKVVYP